MKKLLLMVLLVLLSINMNAQDGLKGTWFLGGQLSYGERNHGTRKNNETMALPIAGIFVTPSVAIGTGIGYMGGENYDEFINTTVSSDNFVFKPLVRHYWNITGDLFFYGQAALPLIIGTKGPFGKKGNLTKIGLELSPGFDYIINSWLSIETSFNIFNIAYTKDKPKNGEATTSFEINANPFNSMNDRSFGVLQIGVKFLL